MANFEHTPLCRYYGKQSRFISPNVGIMILTKDHRMLDFSHRLLNRHIEPFPLKAEVAVHVMDSAL